MLEYLVLGGGISGVTACEELLRIARDEDDGQPPHPLRLTLLHCGGGTLLTRVAAIVRHSDRLEEVTRLDSLTADAFARELREVAPAHVQVRTIAGRVVALDTETKRVRYTPEEDDTTPPAASPRVLDLPYDKVCVCTGARPRELFGGQSPPAQLLTIRDAASIAHLAKEIATPVPALAGSTNPSRSKRIVIVGNGGIALELVHALRTSQLDTINATDAVAVAAVAPADDTLPPLSLPPLSVRWVVSHMHLGHPFLDHMASAFLMPALFPEKDPHNPNDAAAAQQPPTTTPYIQEERIVHTPHGHFRTKYYSPNGAAPTSAASPSAVADSPSVFPSASAPISASSTAGPALGPNWLSKLSLDTNVPKYVQERARLKAAATSADADSDSASAAAHAAAVAHSPVDLALDLSCEITEVHSLSQPSVDSYPLLVVLTNGARIECDLLVSACGVQPNTDWCPPALLRAEDGGILIDECMATSLPDVFAAGDAATLRFSARAHEQQHLSSSSATTTDRTLAERPLLFHSARLWSHAKLFGMYAARAMSGAYAEELADLDGFNLLLFAHTTLILGRKAVLLGRFNLQGYTRGQVRALKAAGRLRTLVRCKTKETAPRAEAEAAAEEEWIKLHLVDGRVIGAVLIGGVETCDLEETMENLAVNQTDLTEFGDFLNDVDIDIADYFD